MLQFCLPGRGGAVLLRSVRVCGHGMLHPGAVQQIVPVKEQLGELHEAKALVLQDGDDIGQGLHGVRRAVVKEEDAAAFGAADHPLGDLFGGEALPVQGVTIGAGWSKGAAPVNAGTAGSDVNNPFDMAANSLSERCGSHGTEKGIDGLCGQSYNISYMFLWFLPGMRNFHRDGQFCTERLSVL